MTGVAGAILQSTVIALETPALSVAVITDGWLTSTTVGVPVICPVAASIASPGGSPAAAYVREQSDRRRLH
jgi:hypothetical protein